MKQVGSVDSLWRYPVKSMRGERLEVATLNASGIVGDRLYAFHDTGAAPDFPYLTARQREQMLLYQPRLRPTAAAMASGSENSAGDLGSGIEIEVETPSGACYAIDDEALLTLLGEGLGARHHLSLLRADTPITDAQPVSLFSNQTARLLGDELGQAIDKRRFRANIYLEMAGEAGFAEDAFVGQRLRVGESAVLTVLERDPRCKIITLDPETAEASPELMRRVAEGHDRCAGIYASVAATGHIRAGDGVFLLDS